MAYARSIALNRWLVERPQSIQRIAEAHAHMGEVDGPGRPLEIGRPLGHAFILRLAAEFQGFARDLFDLCAEHLIRAAAAPAALQPLLTRGLTGGRAMDSGNATLTALRTDFGRLGVRNLEGKLALRYSQWDAANGGGDPKRFSNLLALRNALAHGNQDQVDEHRRQGHADTISWARQQIPVLNRAARGLDRIMWEHLKARTGAVPW